MNLFQKSNLYALQSFIAVLMSLSLGNIIIGYYNVHFSNGDKLIWEVGIGHTMLFISSTVFLIRFFHGNIRILHESYELSATSKPSIRYNQFIDWLVVLLQTVIFSFLGLLFSSQINFQLFILLILMIDFIWLLASDVAKRKDTSRKVQIAKSCAAINGICFLLLGSVEFAYYYETFDAKVTGIIFGSILISASIFDYIYNLSFYFPKTQQKNSK